MFVRFRFTRILILHYRDDHIEMFENLFLSLRFSGMPIENKLISFMIVAFIHMKNQVLSLEC